MGGSSRPGCLSAGDSSRSGRPVRCLRRTPGILSFRYTVQGSCKISNPIQERAFVFEQERTMGKHPEIPARIEPCGGIFRAGKRGGPGGRRVPACGIEVALMGSGQRFREQVAAGNSAATCQIFGTKHHKNASRREVSCSNPGGFRGSRSSIWLERNLHMDWCGVSPAAGSSRPVRQVEFTDNYLFERLAFEHGGV